MNKQEFLEKLDYRLSDMPGIDKDERISFYSEMIDDRIEEGLSEEKAVESIGDIDDIIDQIISEIPLSTIVKEKVKPDHKLKGFEIALLILGFPLWFPLLIAAASILLSIYISLWAAVVSLWAADLCFILSAPAGLVLSLILLFNGQAANSAFMFGCAFIFAGLSIFLFFLCLYASKGLIILIRKIATGIKNSLIRKEN